MGGSGGSLAGLFTLAADLILRSAACLAAAVQASMAALDAVPARCKRRVQCGSQPCTAKAGCVLHVAIVFDGERCEQQRARWKSSTLDTPCGFKGRL